MVSSYTTTALVLSTPTRFAWSSSLPSGQRSSSTMPHCRAGLGESSRKAHLPPFVRSSRGNRFCSKTSRRVSNSRGFSRELRRRRVSTPSLLSPLRNAGRHAGANKATVRLQFKVDRVQFEFQDNGTGFDPDQRCGGLGLLTIHERAEQLGAYLEIQTTPGQGTAVRVNLPRVGVGSARPAPRSREE